MGTHLIPREIDGDARILLFFTPMGFIGLLGGIFVGTILYNIAKLFGATIIGWLLLGLFSLIGFIVGQIKIPESNSFSLFKKVGGEYIRDIIKRYFMFKKTRKIYLYDATEYKEAKVEEKKKR